MADRKRVLVVINPVAGAGEAQDVYMHEVEPFLMADFDVEAVVTQRNDKMLDLLAEVWVEESRLEAVVVLGGDGSVHDVVNALFKLPGAEQVRVCPIPVGSGNALCRSLFTKVALPSDVFSVKFFVDRFREWSSPVSLPLWRYTADDRSGLSFLGMSVGFLADVDFESEFLRPFLGGWRFDVYGLWKWLTHNKPYFVEGTVNQHPPVKLPESYCHLLVTNLPYISETVVVSTESTVDDPRLHLMVLKGRTSKCSLLGTLATMHRPDYLGKDDVWTCPIDAVSLRNPCNHMITIDGEMFPNTRHVSLQPSCHSLLLI
jgi:diacylglycerol kinase family enzyme